MRGEQHARRGRARLRRLTRQSVIEIIDQTIGYANAGIHRVDISLWVVFYARASAATRPFAVSSDGGAY